MLKSLFKYTDIFYSTLARNPFIVLGKKFNSIICGEGLGEIMYFFNSSTTESEGVYSYGYLSYFGEKISYKPHNQLPTVRKKRSYIMGLIESLPKKRLISEKKKLYKFETEHIIEALTNYSLLSRPRTSFSIISFKKDIFVTTNGHAMYINRDITSEAQVSDMANIHIENRSFIDLIRSTGKHVDVGYGEKHIFFSLGSGVIAVPIKDEKSIRYFSVMDNKMDTVFKIKDIKKFKQGIRFIDSGQLIAGKERKRRRIRVYSYPDGNVSLRCDNIVWVSQGETMVLPLDISFNLVYFQKFCVKPFEFKKANKDVDAAILISRSDGPQLYMMQLVLADDEVWGDPVVHINKSKEI